MSQQVSANAQETDVQVLLTASEAYPVLERMVLAARQDVEMCFRIFDPWTKLYSAEAQAIGTTWMDLIAHTLARGVRVAIIITDFDPVMRPEPHRDSWASVRAIAAAGELSGRSDLLRVRASMHPARVGGLLRVLLWPLTYGHIRETARRVNDDPKTDAGRFLAEVPYLRSYLRLLGGRLASRRWPVPRLMPVTHHQKIAIADGRVLYIGGLDLNDRRYDTLLHDQPGEQTWHDVQLRITGPEVGDAQRHLASFEAATRGDQPPPALPHILRTLSRRRRFNLLRISPARCLTELADAHLKAVQGSERFIYIETQYFRDRRLARALARAARDKPDLQLLLILPAAPDDVAFEEASSGDARYGEYLQAKSVDIIRRAFGKRLFIGSPAQRKSSDRGDRGQLYGAPLIYVHAKVAIFDARSAIISSANLNGRSLYWDTEAGVLLRRADHAEDAMRKCFSHWQMDDAGPEFFAPDTAVAAWRDRARQNVRRAPEDRVGFILPYVSAPARRFGRNLPGIPEEMV